MRLTILPKELLGFTPHQINPEQGRCTKVLRLPHPRTGLASLFLLHGNYLLEFQQIDPPEPRSWFLESQVVEDGRLLFPTPIDPSFLLIPLIQHLYPKGDSPGQFRSAEDLFEEAATKFCEASHKSNETIYKEHILEFLASSSARSSLNFICETKVIPGDFTVHRVSPIRTLAYLRKKVNRVATSNIQDQSPILLRSFAKEGLMEDDKEKLLQAARLRAACDMIAHYLSEKLNQELIASYDFVELDAYIKQNEFSTIDGGETTGKGTANKGITGKSKAKGEPFAVAGSKKRKDVKGSHGVEQLKKVNTSGISKLSTFFKKA